MRASRHRESGPQTGSAIHAGGTSSTTITRCRFSPAPHPGVNSAPRMTSLGRSLPPPRPQKARATRCSPSALPLQEALTGHMLPGVNDRTRALGPKPETVRRRGSASRAGARSVGALPHGAGAGRGAAVRSGAGWKPARRERPRAMRSPAGQTDHPPWPRCATPRVAAKLTISAPSRPPTDCTPLIERLPSALVSVSRPCEMTATATARSVGFRPGPPPRPRRRQRISSEEIARTPGPGARVNISSSLTPSAHARMSALSLAVS